MALSVLSLCPFDISAGVWAFVMGLSQISSFFSIVFSITIGLYCRCRHIFEHHEKIFAPPFTILSLWPILSLKTIFETCSGNDFSQYLER